MGLLDKSSAGIKKWRVMVIAFPTPFNKNTIETEIQAKLNLGWIYDGTMTDGTKHFFVFKRPKRIV